MSRPLDSARNSIAGMAQGQFVLLGVSGGADSLAMAIASSELVRAGRLRAGALIVDHGLQPGSGAAADRAAKQCRALGLDPVLVRTVETSADEASARDARYRVFETELQRSGAQSLLLAHTLDDQAEQVLLGLARGSGTRSLAGMPPVRGPYLRPLLGLDRGQMEQICQGAGLEYWHDPSNEDTAYKRNLIRHRVLPALRAELGEHLSQALANTAKLAAQDADALDQWAQHAYEQACDGTQVRMKALAGLPVAVASRVLRLAAREAGAANLTLERTQALLRLAGVDSAKSKSAGPVQLDGEISAFRRGPVIVFTRTG